MARNFIGPIFLCLTFSLFFGHAQAIDSKTKSAIVKGILKKVLNLTLSSFTNITNLERKKMMVDIKEKLRKSSQFLGSKSERYVELIMDGVRSLTAQNYKTNNLEDVWDDSSNEAPEGIIGADLKKRQKLIKKTAKKIHAIAAASMKDAKTPQEREDILSDIQNKVIDAAIKKHVSVHPEDKDKMDVKSVAHYMMELMMEDEFATGQKKFAKIPIIPDARRMEFEFNENIDVNKNLMEENSSKSVETNKFDVNNNIKPYTKHVEPKSLCTERNETLCKKLKELRHIKCDNKDISVEKLCDGINDCSDKTDEQNCSIQGVNILKKASQLMLDIDRALSDRCLTTQINDTLLSKQNEILNHVLKSQLHFIQSHANVTRPRWSNKTIPESEIIRKIVHEVAIVITTLSAALKHSICTSDEDFDVHRRFNALDEMLQEQFDYEAMKTTTWSPNVCKCVEDSCEGTCKEACNSLCMERYQINRMLCNAVNGKNSVPLDFICDGKLDCFDESDENGCFTVTGIEKFEATKLYDFVITMILLKAKAAKFESIRIKMIYLHELIKNLQRETTKPRVDVSMVTTFRNRCFTEMISIYDLTKYYAVDMESMHDIHKFLMSVGDKLIIAMKRSHSGNYKLIESGGCMCSNNTCSLQRCSETCMRACPAEKKLTRYFCGGSLTNQSIPIESICNNKVDCPGKDDEDDCNLDICRRHHLIVLRHNIQKVVADLEAVAITGGLMSWQTKQESAMLKVLESDERPSPRVLRNTVKVMLRDLLMTYATAPSRRRRSNDDVIKQYYKAALVVMQSLKSCSK